MGAVSGPFTAAAEHKTSGRSGNDQQGTGDAQLAGCGHVQGAGAPGQAGAGELALDAITWVAGTAGPNDPSSTSGLMFYLTGYTITFKGHGSQHSFTTSVTNPYTNAVNPGLEGAVNGFLGDTGIPMSAGHYGFHPAPGLAGMLQVSFRPGH